MHFMDKISIEISTLYAKFLGFCTAATQLDSSTEQLLQTEVINSYFMLLCEAQATGMGQREAMFLCT